MSFDLTQCLCYCCDAVLRTALVASEMLSVVNAASDNATQ